MTAKFIVLPLAATLTVAWPALAQQVGTATAVNPMTESTPPGGSTNKLAVGARVVHKERIHTSPTGSVQLLFLDKSSLNIAPNTNLLIDEFVYDPTSGSGHMLTSLTRGTLQFIGGKLSHEGAVTVTTPAAAVGIRGGTATIEHGAHGTQVTNQYGTLTIRNGGGTMVVTRPGFVVTIANWNTVPGTANARCRGAGQPPHPNSVEHVRPKRRRARFEQHCHRQSSVAMVVDRYRRERRFGDHSIDTAGDDTDTAADYARRLKSPADVQSFQLRG
jgi:hypothetical protein